VLPATTAFVGAGDNGLDPGIQTQPATYRCLTGQHLGNFVVTYIVVVRQYGRDGGVEYAEEAQRGADAIGTVPEGGGGEQVRCEE
jgi:hypothetical protein